VPLYVLVSAYFLYSFASLSGEPSVASRYWAIKYPDSVRAVSTMATYQLAEEGPISALSTIDHFVIERPQFGYLRIQELNLRCMYLPDQNHEPVLEELRRELPDVDFTYTAGTMLSQLFSSVIASNCRGVDLDTVAELAETLQRNPRYVLVPKYNQFHHKLMAGIARQRGDYDATIDHLEKAIAQLGAADLNMMMVTALGGAGDFDSARRFIDEALLQHPVNPLQAAVWRRDLEKLRDYIRELERYSRSAE
jgi:tetratricopeptide (TPR) repeat protein